MIIFKESGSNFCYHTIIPNDFLEKNCEEYYEIRCWRHWWRHLQLLMSWWNMQSWSLAPASKRNYKRLSSPEIMRKNCWEVEVLHLRRVNVEWGLGGYSTSWQTFFWQFEKLWEVLYTWTFAAKYKFSWSYMEIKLPI